MLSKYPLGLAAAISIPLASATIAVTHAGPPGPSLVQPSALTVQVELVASSPGVNGPGAADRPEMARLVAMAGVQNLSHPCRGIRESQAQRRNRALENTGAGGPNRAILYIHWRLES